MEPGSETSPRSGLGGTLRISRRATPVAPKPPGWQRLLTHNTKVACSNPAPATKRPGQKQSWPGLVACGCNQTPGARSSRSGGMCECGRPSPTTASSRSPTTTMRAKLTVAADRGSMQARRERIVDGDAWEHWMDMAFTRIGPIHVPARWGHITRCDHHTDLTGHGTRAMRTFSSRSGSPLENLGNLQPNLQPRLRALQVSGGSWWRFEFCHRYSSRVPDCRRGQRRSTSSSRS